MNKPEAIIVHHTAVSSRVEQIKGVNRFHRLKGYPVSSLGWFVGYHFFIHQNGRIERCRADSDVGAHTLNGWNKKSIGICLAGDFNRDAPTLAQLASLKTLLQQYNLPWMFHKDADPRRTCAGHYLTRELVEKQFEPEAVSEIEKREAIQKEISAIRMMILKLQVLISRITTQKI